MRMLKNSRKSGFTLLETLVSLAILTMVLGASVISGRAMYQQSQINSDQAQMSALADESIATVRLLRDTTTRAAGAGLFGLSPTASAKGAFYMAPITSTSSADAGSALFPRWCSGSGCSALVSSVGVDDDGVAAKCPSGPGNCTVGALGDKELVAVRRSSSAVTLPTGCGARAVFDLTAVGASTCVKTSAIKDWDFYVREITVTRGGGSTAFGANTYSVKVSLTNHHNPQSTLTKTMLLTDYLP
jgi:prepilin-type N-terminal cleavage/methylation domain-containing protein